MGGGASAFLRIMKEIGLSCARIETHQYSLCKGGLFQGSNAPPMIVVGSKESTIKVSTDQSCEHSLKQSAPLSAHPSAGPGNLYL